MTHQYISTACQHGLCPVGGLQSDKSMCIRSCKYCDDPCRCACHSGETAPTGRLYGTLYASVAPLWDNGTPNADDVVTAALDAMLGMPRTQPDRAADRLSAWLESDKPDATLFRQGGHLAVDLQVLIAEFRHLREGQVK